MSQHSFGPPELGRGVIVRSDQPAPDEFATCPEFSIDREALDARSASLAHELHELWSARQPFVIRLGIEASELKAAARESNDSAAWEVGSGFLFHRARLHFLAWNNNWDLRSGTPIWWWAHKAVPLGVSATGPDETGDVILPDGTAAYCDGGPVEPVEPVDVDAAIVPYTAIERGSLATIGNGSPAGNLAADQLGAVAHSGGPARIIAPAGSGKTRVLTERLHHLHGIRKLDPTSICTVAYNTRAAAELTERTTGLAAQIRTLNSLGLAIVNGTGGFGTSELETGQRSVIDERAVRQILQGLVSLPRRVGTDPMAVWIEALSSVRLGLRSPESVESESGDLTDFSDTFDRYRRHLESHRLLDFDEQIYRAIEILMRDPVARVAAQRRCRALLVDEFQDLTPAHMLMLRLLGSPALDIFGVGDDDQVIYGYAGADPRYLVDFERWFPGASTYALEVNYRCPPSVITAASNLLTRNSVRVDKTIRPRPGRESTPAELDVEEASPETAAKRAIEIVEGWLGECNPSDVAVLTRVNVTLLPIQVLMKEYEIAHTRSVSASLLERTGIRAALAYLRIGFDTDNITRSDIVDTVRRPSRKIAQNVVQMMTKRPTTSLSDLRRIAGFLTDRDGPRVATYIDDLNSVSRATRSGDTAHVLDTIRNKVGLGDALEVLDGSRREADRSTHADDLAALQAVAHLHPDPATFEDWLHSALRSDGAESASGVELSTVHRVKGREWRRVVVFGASVGLMPHRLATDPDEERRVFHVAITRCSEQVAVISESNAASPYIVQMESPGSPEQIVRPSASGPPSQPQPTKTGPNSHNSNDRVVTALKEWRSATARSMGVPAFTVLHDSHIEGIANAMPSNMTELSRCKGIGATKLDRWGDEILSLLVTL